MAPQSTAYNVWTGRQGDCSKCKYYSGSRFWSIFNIFNTICHAGAIFKSQNGALWTEDQTQDITFKLYKAKFTSQSGSAYFNNPKLSDSNGYVPSIR